MAQDVEVSEYRDFIDRIKRGTEGRDLKMAVFPRADEFHTSIDVLAKDKKSNQILRWHWEIDGGSYKEVADKLDELDRRLRGEALPFERRGWIGARAYDPEAVCEIVVLALAVGSILALALWMAAVELHLFIPPEPMAAFKEPSLVRLVLAFGVIGSSLRGIGEFFNDVGNRRFDPAWSLSYLMRPLEGAGMALMVFLAVRGGFELLSPEASAANALGYLFVAALAGMFSHRAVEGLRRRFDRFFSA